MGISASDRKRLWGKAANRCAWCETPLTRPGRAAAPEVVIGEEAHIVGEKPGSARYRPLPPDMRDAYENRILLCPTYHTIVDGQPQDWTEEALHHMKSAHELRMQLRTRRPTDRPGLVVEPPGPVELPPVIGGTGLLEIVAGALAFQFDHDVPETDRERDAMRALLDEARNWGEIASDLGPGERMDAADHLGGLYLDALEAHLLVYGTLVDMTVHYGDHRERWPVAVLLVRRAENVAADQRRRGVAVPESVPPPASFRSGR